MGLQGAARCPGSPAVGRIGIQLAFLLAFAGSRRASGRTGWAPRGPQTRGRVRSHVGSSPVGISHHPCDPLRPCPTAGPPAVPQPPRRP
eukprot:2210850-Pyramimonas_sp.AAC.2